jgi:hypothetical protein
VSKFPWYCKKCKECGLLVVKDEDGKWTANHKYLVHCYDTHGIPHKTMNKWIWEHHARVKKWYEKCKKPS